MLSFVRVSLLGLCAMMVGVSAWAEVDGFLAKDGARLFPVGFYELPKDEAGLKAMADAGVNIVHCHSRADLDRVAAVGMRGVFPLAWQQGRTDGLRAQVLEAAGHPALAVWEGPDEVVWNFTAYSGLFRKMGVHKVPGAWWKQTPEAVAYAEEKAGEIIPNMREVAAMIREIDESDRPLWINEAQSSDLGYVRQYLDFVDITGCDIYPVNDDKRPVERVGHSTARWLEVGRGIPVYMVLQAFSWHELGDYYGPKEPAYPSFAESRFMAYDAIVRGARGIFYWGSRFLKAEDFRESLYALTSELAAVQPFLVAGEVAGLKVRVVDLPDKLPAHVAMMCRNVGDEWLIVVVNEDDLGHMGVVVSGLEALEGRTLYRLYHPGEAVVRNGELVARILGRDVQVFATSRARETARLDGRDYVHVPAASAQE